MDFNTFKEKVLALPLPKELFPEEEGYNMKMFSMMVELSRKETLDILEDFYNIFISKHEE